MKLKALALYAALLSITSAPAFAAHGSPHPTPVVAFHPSAVAIFCEAFGGSDFDGFSRFVSNHGLFYTGGVTTYDGDDGIGFRIDTLGPHGANTFTFDLTSTGSPNPNVFYEYSTDGGATELQSASGVTFQDFSNGVRRYTFDIRRSNLPANAVVTDIYFSDFGLAAFSDTVTHALVNGFGVTPHGGLQSDCAGEQL